MNDLISIVIPVKNGVKGGIGKCLSGIFAQKTSSPYEVIAIDSGSTDGTLDIIRAYPQVRLIQIRPEEFGHGRTRNLGAKEAKGDVLIFINQDAWPASDKWLDELVRPFSEDIKIAGVYSRQISKPDAFLYIKKDVAASFGPDRKVNGMEDLIEARRHPVDILRKRIHSVIFFSTVSAALRKDAWSKLPFEDDIPFAEDQEWSKKAILNGYKIEYVPSSMVYHSHNYSFREIFKVHDPSVKLFDRLLERRLPGYLIALPYFFWNIFVRPLSDIIFIIKEKGGVSYKLGEIYISIVSRTLVTITRTLSLLGSPFINRN